MQSISSGETGADTDGDRKLRLPLYPAPPPRLGEHRAILLALSGLAAAVTFPAFYMLGAVVFGLAGLVHFRQSSAR
jgi:hypothetical protein